jgi:hypothetical protein
VRRRQSGCQSPEQPSSDCSEPAIVTAVGWGVCEASAEGSVASSATSAKAAASLRIGRIL